jgi:hypothetical protein
MLYCMSERVLPSKTLSRTEEKTLEESLAFVPIYWYSLPDSDEGALTDARLIHKPCSHNLALRLHAWRSTHHLSVWYLQKTRKDLIPILYRTTLFPRRSSQLGYRTLMLVYRTLMNGWAGLRARKRFLTYLQTIPSRLHFSLATCTGQFEILKNHQIIPVQRFHKMSRFGC